MTFARLFSRIEHGSASLLTIAAMRTPNSGFERMKPSPHQNVLPWFMIELLLAAILMPAACSGWLFVLVLNGLRSATLTLPWGVVVSRGRRLAGYWLAMGLFSLVVLSSAGLAALATHWTFAPF